MNTLIALALALHACSVLASPASPDAKCHEGSDVVSLETDRGLVCGLKRLAENGVVYASFRGVPYAKQPLGELRFKELELADYWDVINATHEGPICMQTDVLYGKMMNQTQRQSEACIYANIHVPLEALPGVGRSRLVRELQPRYPKEVSSPLLPILVFIHGGGFAFGSGDADLHGPEYLVSKDVIVITFNYRLNVFGFLSLNTTKIPGNAGLRDQVTLLNWVKRNAKYFGGDPDDVTIAGQSAGAWAAHLLTLSPATEGLFKRAILMSGTATSTFFSPSAKYAAFMTKELLKYMDITSTDPDDIHRELIRVSADKLKEANKALLDLGGLTSFVPIVESPLPGVTTIIDDDPEILISNGRGKNIPLLVGYTSAECETFRKRLQEFNLTSRILMNGALIVPPKTLMSAPVKFLMDLVKKMDDKYYNGMMNLDNFVRACSDGFYEYPALKLAQKRAGSGGASVFLYRFAYQGHSNVIKQATGLSYEGVGHIEDLTYVFKANSVVNTPEAIPPSANDIRMKNLMTEFFVNFIKRSKPDESSIWPADNGHQFEDIESPTAIKSKDFSARQQDIITFFDDLSAGLTVEKADDVL